MSAFDEALDALREALIDDKVTQAQSDSDLVRDFITEGFAGFNKMTVKELIDCAHEADLVNRSYLVEGYVDTLEEHLETTRAPQA